MDRVTTSAGFGGPPTAEELEDIPDLTPAPEDSALPGGRLSTAVGVGVEPPLPPTHDSLHTRFAASTEGVEATAPSAAPPLASAVPGVSVNPHHPRFRPHVATGTPASGAGAASAPAAGGVPAAGPATVAPRKALWLRHVNPHGPFRLYESLTEQLERLGGLRTSSPQFAAALMQQGQCLVRLAAVGEHGKIVSLVNASEEGEILFWYTAKMFIAACQGGHVDVVRYMVCEGLDLRLKGIAEAVHVAVEHAPDVSAATVVTDLLDVGFPVNYQRKGDYYTPLHVACAGNRHEVAGVLVARGADVNSVAGDDAMPLALAAAAEEGSPLVELLVARGARATWRVDPPPPPPPAPAAAAGAGGELSRRERLLDLSTS